VNGQHFCTFLWLRWRLRINQLKRSGIANVVVLIILATAAVVSAAILFVVFFSLGLFGLSDAAPVGLMYILDGVVVMFLFLWITGLLTELQRLEALSLEKFLHLPVSLSSAFLINYLSSLPSVSLLWFLSAMLGLNFGLLLSRGWTMLWLLPMLAAFVLMVTALTYQFQGWLAALMTNPRRRRTIIVVATMVFILLAQVPNLVNILFQWQNQPRQAPLPPPPPFVQDQKEPNRQEELARYRDLLGEFHARRERENEERLQRTVWLMNLILPPGWLPAGVEAAAEGRAWLILLAILGPTLIGTASLWRAYRTTLRLYTGQYTSGRTAGVPARSASKEELSPLLALRAGKGRASLLERKLPWLSEQASAITLAVFRSLLRAPEAKMLLLTPLLLLVIFGSGFLATAGRTDLPEAARSLTAFGAMVMVLFSMAQILGNQFGFDRDGFRVFILSPVRRRDILLAKNLAVAPIALTMGTAAAILVQIVYPMRLDHFLALAPRFVSMYLLYCLPANTLSIFSPLRVAPTSFQPTHPGGMAILWQMLFLFLCPAIMALTLLPLGIEWIAEAMGGRQGMPLDLLLSLLECAVITLIYGLFLRIQGDWLHAREQRILQIVTTRAN
jgi:ABC-2 type transport system permease protein